MNPCTAEAWKIQSDQQFTSVISSNEKEATHDHNY